MPSILYHGPIAGFQYSESPKAVENKPRSVREQPKLKSAAQPIGAPSGKSTKNGAPYGNRY